MHRKNEDTKYEKDHVSSIKGLVRRNIIYAVLAFVVLCVGVGAIIAGVAGSGNPVESPPVNTNDILDNYTPPVNTQTPEIVKPTATVPIVSTPTPIIQITPSIPDTPVPTSGPVSSDTEVSFYIDIPFGAESVINEFSGDELVFSDTLEEWVTHAGIDIKCSVGTNVCSAADGIVLDIIDDPLYGITVVIQHTDGFSTLYSGVDASSVSKDELVARGQIIGVASGDIPIEDATEETHIHFELFKDGKIIDPLEYIR